MATLAGLEKEVKNLNSAMASRHAIYLTNISAIFRTAIAPYGALSDAKLAELVRSGKFTPKGGK
jgi:hypothetical protein